MRWRGNGDIAVCANNLLRMTRGEVPYERTKGIDPRLVDSPESDVELEIKQDAEWLLNTYEPRAKAKNIKIDGNGPGEGGFAVTVNIE